jgi:hypothetical protein
MITQFSGDGAGYMPHPDLDCGPADKGYDYQCGRYFLEKDRIQVSPGVEALYFYQAKYMNYWLVNASHNVYLKPGVRYSPLVDVSLQVSYCFSQTDSVDAINLDSSGLSTEDFYGSDGFYEDSGGNIYDVSCHGGFLDDYLPSSGGNKLLWQDQRITRIGVGGAIPASGYSGDVIQYPFFLPQKDKFSGYFNFYDYYVFRHGYDNSDFNGSWYLDMSLLANGRGTAANYYGSISRSNAVPLRTGYNSYTYYVPRKLGCGFYDESSFDDVYSGVRMSGGKFRCLYAFYSFGSSSSGIAPSDKPVSLVLVMIEPPKGDSGGDENSCAELVFLNYDGSFPVSRCSNATVDAYSFVDLVDCWRHRFMTRFASLGPFNFVPASSGGESRFSLGSLPSLGADEDGATIDFSLFNLGGVGGILLFASCLVGAYIIFRGSDTGDK